MTILSPRRVLLALLCCGAAAPAQTGWKELAGEMVPEIRVNRWLNTEENVTTDSLKGHVWMIEFFATWCGPCMLKVGRLSELHAKYSDRGFRIVAISAEEPSQLEKEMLEQRGVKYWIGSDPSSYTMRKFSHDEKIGIPHAYLIDASGRVVSNGFPSEDQIVELLAQPPDAGLGRQLHDKLRVAQELYECGGYGAALRTAAPFFEHADASLAEDAKLLRDKVAQLAEHARRNAEWQLANSDVGVGYGQLVVLRIAFEGLEVGSWADGRAKELRDDKGIYDDRAAWRRVQEALKVELRARGRATDRDRARQIYAQVIDQHRHKPPARLARERLEKYLADAK